MGGVDSSSTVNYVGVNGSVNPPPRKESLYPDDVISSAQIPVDRGYDPSEAPIKASSNLDGATGTLSSTLGRSSDTNDPNIHRIYIYKPHVSFTVVISSVYTTADTDALPDCDMKVFDWTGAGQEDGAFHAHSQIYPVAESDGWDDSDPETSGTITTHYKGHYLLYVRPQSGTFVVQSDNTYTVTVTYNT